MLFSGNSFCADPNRNFLEDGRLNQYSNHSIEDEYEEYEEYEEYSDNYEYVEYSDSDEFEYSDEKEDKFLFMYSEYLTNINNGIMFVNQKKDTELFLKELTENNIKLTDQKKYRKSGNSDDGYNFLKEFGILTKKDVSLIYQTDSLEGQNFINLYVGYMMYVNKGFVKTRNELIQYIDMNLNEFSKVKDMIKKFREEEKIRNVIDNLLEERVNLYGEENIKNKLWFNVIDSDDFAKIKELSKKVDLSIIDSNQNNILHIFTKQGDTKKIAWLLKHDNVGKFINKLNFWQETPLLIAIGNKRYDIVKLLVDNGAEVNGLNEQSKIPLIYAAEKGNFDIVKCLVEKGADVNSKSINGLCALANAVHYGFLEMVIYLVDNNADVKYTDSKGENLLTIASRMNHYEIFAYLTDKKLIDINHETKKGMTVLFYAINKFRNESEILEYALDNGADINRVSKIKGKEETPLTIAIKLKKSECVKFLIGRNAHVTQAALDIAKQQETQDIFDMLVEAKEKQQERK